MSNQMIKIFVGLLKLGIFYLIQNSHIYGRFKLRIMITVKKNLNRNAAKTLLVNGKKKLSQTVNVNFIKYSKNPALDLKTI